MAEIKDLNESWEDHSFDEVETFLKQQIADIVDQKLTTISVVIEGPTTRAFIDGSDDITFSYKVNSFISGNYNANFTVHMKVGDLEVRDKDVNDIIENMVSIDENTVISTPNLAGYFSEIQDTNVNVEIWAETADGSVSVVRSIRFTRRVDNLIFATHLGEVNPSVLSFYTQFEGTTAKIIAKIYGASGTVNQSSYVEVTSPNDLTISGAASLAVPTGLTPGTHRVEAVLRLADGTVSETVETDIIITLNAIQDDVFIATAPVTGAVQNDYSEIEYVVVIAGGGAVDTVPVILRERNTTTNAYVEKAIRNVTNGVHSVWEYEVPYAGLNQLQILVPQLDAQGNIRRNLDGTPVARNIADISFEAESTEVSWTAKENPEIYLNALDKTNDDYSPDVWTYNNYSAEFISVDFDDNASGWTGQNHLHLIGTSRVRIRKGVDYFYPFYDNTPFESRVTGGGILSTGFTMKMSFMVNNVSNPEEKLISCYDPVSGIGFYVTGDSIYVNVGSELTSSPTESPAISGHNVRKFSAGIRIDLTIALQPYYENRVETKHEVRYYVNGEIAGFGVVEPQSLSQSNENKTYLEFGGSGASLDLYDFRYYKTYLRAFDVLQTRTMDLDSSHAIKSVFEKNRYYVPYSPTVSRDSYAESGEPVITLEQALSYGRYLAEQGHTNFAVWLSTNLCNDEVYLNNTKEHAMAGRVERFYVYRFKTNSDGEGIIDDALTFMIESAGDSIDSDGNNSCNLRLRRQGTSTASATKGNIRVDTRGTCNYYTYNSSSGRFVLSHTVGKKARVWQIPDAHAKPCYLLTCKKNPNESTQARNLPTAKWYEDCCRTLATVAVNGEYKYEDCLTPPQRQELATIRTEHPEWTRAEQVAAISTRQTVDGIPSLGFEIQRDLTEANKVQPRGSMCYFGGQFDMITDKTNMDVFGFGAYVDETGNSIDEDFSIEWRNNGSAVCNFHDADLTTAGDQLPEDYERGSSAKTGTGDLQYRYPDDDRLTVAGHSIGLEEGGPIQRLFDFVCNCAPDNVGYTYTNGKATYSTSITVDGIELPDNVANRREKFRRELKHYVVVNQILYNGLAIDVGLMVDQDTKNQFFTHFTGETDEGINKRGTGNKVLRLLGYDFDSGWGTDNDDYFRFDYTVMYDDGLYDSSHDPSKDGKGHGSERGSDFWKLVYDCFEDEIADIARALYASGLLSASGILRYMHDNQVDLYNAMIYNANSEYSYTSSQNDYQKAHGSAREHNTWFVEGRAYFTAGKYFESPNENNDFAEDAAGYFEIPSFSADNGLFDSVNIYNHNYNPDGTQRHWELKVTAYERTYAYLRAGQSVQRGYLNGTNTELGGFVDVEKQYEHGELTGTTHNVRSLYSNVDFGTGDARMFIYGGKKLKTIDGLQWWYPSGINKWAKLLNVEELVLGSTALLADGNGNTAYYNNPMLSQLGLADTDVFSSCRLLNLAGCSNFTTLSLKAFPQLEVFEGTRMSKLRDLVLPIGDSLRVVHYPKGSLTSIRIENKPNLEEMRFDLESAGEAELDTLEEIVVTNSSSYAATEALELLLKLTD